MEAYWDGVIALNFAINFLLLVGVNRLSGFPAGFLRAGSAAAIGSVYAAACLVPGFQFLGNSLWRCVILIGMGLLAYGLQRSAIGRTVLFVLASIALGGIVLGLENGSFLAVVAAMAVVWSLYVLRLEGKLRGAELVPVTVRSKHATVHITALVDTGNTLRDPISGEGVLVLDAETAYALVGLTHQQLMKPLETVVSGTVPGLRLIPFRSVGQPYGMLLAQRMEEVKIRKRKAGTLVAFAPVELSGAGRYQALTGGGA